jgi:D-psicose/D-tagatose/L-ribulose 3-epimerase
MNKIGIYYAYWTRDWDADFHPYVDKVADLGFDVLEVNAGTVAHMSAAERKRLRDHAGARGIELSYCIGLPPRFDVASEDAGARREGIRFLGEIVGAIGEMGGGRLSGIVYGCWPALMPEGVTDKRPFLDRSVASLKQVLPLAEDRGVVLNMAEEGLEFVQRIGSPNAKLLLDTYHMNIEEDSIGAAIATAGSFLGHVHLGESNRKPPGHGHIPWAELAGALQRIGYQGWLVMEPFLVPGGQVGRDIRVWRDVGKGMDLDREAGKAVRFMRDRLTEAA